MMGRRFKESVLAVLCLVFVAGVAICADAQVAQQSTNPYLTKQLQDMQDLGMGHPQDSTATAPRAPFLLLPEQVKKGQQPGAGNAASYAAAQPNLTTSGGMNFPGLYEAPYTAAGSSNSLIMASAAADVDNQNGPDLVTVQTDGTLNVLTNDGHGHLGTPYSNTSAVAFHPMVVYIAVADLNRDGFPDIVAMDSANSAFLVFLNNGDGTFANATEVAVTPSSGARFRNGGSLAVGDVNGDGIPDVVTVTGRQSWNGSSYTSIFSQQTFFGNGDGTFSAPTTSTDASLNGFLFIEYGQGLVLTDLNADHIPDMVVEYCDPFNAWVTVTGSLGKGDGTFGPITAGASIRAQQSTFSTLELADLNSDGRQDAVFVIGDGNLYVALGNGNGTFQSPASVLQNLPQAEIIRLGDFNGDGYPDVLVHSDSSAAVYAGRGDGSFNPIPAGQYGAGGSSGSYLSCGTQQPVPADFDGDGHLDFARLDPMYRTVSIYRGAGDGSFLAQRAVAPVNSSSNPPNSSESASNLIVLATGDANGDGKSDVLAYDFSDPFYSGWGVYPDVTLGLSDGKGGFNFSTIMKGYDLAKANVSLVAPIIADFNHDGIFDLLVSTGNGLSIALGKPDGTFSPLSPISLPVATSPCSFSSFDVGDLNKDGNLDVVIAYNGDSPNCVGTDTPSGYFVLLGNGNGGFNASFVQYGFYLYQAKLVDMNGDGNLDLVLDDGYQTGMLIVANAPTPITVLRGKGDGTFDATNPQLALGGWRIAGIVLGDYDADGKPDLTLLSAGQIDSTGRIVPHTHGIVLLKGNGDFTFQDPVLIAPDTFASSAQYADFNGDGLPDLAFTTDPSYPSASNYFGLVLLPNLGGGSFGQPINVMAPRQDTVTMTGDFNGDGALDVLVAPSYATSPSVVFFNQGGSTLSVTATPSAALQGDSVVLQATLSALPGTAAPTGTVSFSANGTVIGTADFNNSIVAELTTSALPVGTDTITATYTGDSNHNPSTAQPVGVTVQPLPPSFTVTPTPQSLALHAGQSGTVALNIMANSTFNGQIVLSCSGLPIGAQCNFSPASVTLVGSQTGSVNVVISTTSQILARNERYRFGWTGALTGFALIPCLVLAWRPRWGTSRRRHLWITSLLCLILLVTLVGCGGNQTGGASGKSAFVTVTASANSGGTTLQRTAIVSVTITK